MLFKSSKKSQKERAQIPCNVITHDRCDGPEGESSLVTVTVIGDHRVGKTSLINRVHQAKFTWTYRPTIGVAKSQLVVQNPEFLSSKVYYNFLDTNDIFFDETAVMVPNSLTAHRHASYARYILVVYDISDHKSFNEARDWVTLLDNMELTDVTKILIGNKTDREAHREVHRSAGQVFAMLKGMVFVETSAKTGYNISNLYNYLCRI